MYIQKKKFFQYKSITQGYLRKKCFRQWQSVQKSGPNLDLLWVRQSDAVPFLKTTQSFILIQNTQKRCKIGGGEICGALFFKNCPFWTTSDAALIFQIRPWKQPPDVIYKKSIFKNSSKFTAKHLFQSLFFNKVAGLILQLY